MMIRYFNSLCPWVVAALLGILLIGSLVVGGCGKEKPLPPESLNLQDVNLSPQLAPFVQESWDCLNPKELPDPEGVLLLTRYQYFKDAFRDLNPAAAIDSFFQIWETDPENLLLIDLAMIARSDLARDPRYEEFMALPALNDTNAAVGCFHLGRHSARPQYQKRLFYKSHDLRHELAPLQEIWLEKRLTIRDRNALRPDDGVQRLLPYLASARQLGGQRLEFELWESITFCLIKGDHLDDALHTAATLEALGKASNSANLQTKAEFWLGRVFEARENLEFAEEHYQNAIDLGRENRVIWFWEISMSRAARIQDSLGNYTGRLQLLEANLELAQASEDSLNIPHYLINLADTYRKMGQLEACRDYQDRASRYVALHPIKRNVTQLPYYLAEYWAHVGQYDKVDSLLNIAMGFPENSDIAVKTIELHTRLIESALEQGRPDLVHRSVVQIDSLYNAALATGGSIKIGIKPDLLMAEFFTRQGQFSRATFHLDRVAVSLEDSPSPEARWELFRARGLLARQRGDLPSAMEAFSRGHQTIADLDNPDLQARSRFLLGSALLEDGQPLEARQLFPPETEQQQFGGRFRTRLASQLFRGLTYAQAEDHEEAVQQFQKALALCSPWSPSDLVARTHLEMGLSLENLNRIPEAADHLHQAWTILTGAEDRNESNSLLAGVFHGSLRHQTVEALITLYLTWPEASSSKKPAHDSLVLWEQLLKSNAVANETNEPVVWAPDQIVFFVGDRISYRWDVTDQGISLHTLPAAHELDQLMAPVISDLTRAGRAIPAGPSRRLAETLLNGVEKCWRRGNTLQLVCDGKLGSLPWAALPLPESFGDNSQKPLLTRGSLVYRQLPLNSRKKQGIPHKPKMIRPLLAIGANTSDGADLNNLDHAEDEALALGSLWEAGPVTTLLGDEATWKTIKNLDLASFSALHIASHARIFPGLPNQSYLVLSKSQGQEQFTAASVAELGLKSELVYLSSCETASATGGQVVGSFVQAFIEAGSQSVIASSLGVDDAASKVLAEKVYTHQQAGLSWSEALRASQLELMNGAGKWSHPFYWAFFRVYK